MQNVKDCAGISLMTGDVPVIGLDIGSTTAKIIAAENGKIVYECYERHYSQVRQKALELVTRAKSCFSQTDRVKISISGSAGLGLAEAAGIPFVQEVFATGETVKALRPDTSVVIELGGEDAKVIFFKGGMDERMNGTCAGGTGAFIDQMAMLLDVSVDEMDALALKHTRLYPIASRCGVFAKTDVQPLLNQGASKEDVAASIYAAVVNQTVAGLAQGRRIEGKVMFLGGPLYYCKGLRASFQEILRLPEEDAIFPEYGRYAVAIGAAQYAGENVQEFTYEALLSAMEKSTREKSETPHAKPLFENEEEYRAFCARHEKAGVTYVYPKDYTGDAYLGIDCGSTTTKLVLMTSDGGILYTYYSSNKGNPVSVVREQLMAIRELAGDRIRICGSAVTGYGEELIRHAFRVDEGLVETMAHFTAARYFNPNVDFILDIGGQDIKCFKVKDNAIDSIMLNEACSSGCGSFIETFAKSMGYGVEEFSKLGLFAKAPVELGSRCTVFMNSSVKEAQKDGASVGDISAGLSMSVVKNAIYKVIRAGSVEELGKEIVVQGGTFHNDAVLRSFEREIGRDVIRPVIAGLMGAYGAALYAKSKSRGESTLLPLADLYAFTHTSKSATCHGCTNQCRLTINVFSGGERYVSGNKCEKGAGVRPDDPKVEVLPNLHQFKRDGIMALAPVTNGRRSHITVGFPQALGMYELAPFWHAIFSDLGIRVEMSGMSTRAIYSLGQYSIPSDTACYPAKIMHGHVETLISRGVDAIFYPCLSYNFDENISQNHYNCPVVAYYSELLAGNVDDLSGTKFMYPYLNICNEKMLTVGLHKMFNEFFGGFSKSEVRHAVRAGYSAYADWMGRIRAEGRRAVAYAEEHGKRVMILAGRPYHVDSEIGHNIDKLATALGFVVVSEDSISDLAERQPTYVLNQWTYHARLYNAARYAVEHPGTELVQLVSFGCGIDAVTTDEVRSILEYSGKLYTQIKIDEITNLGAVNIRLRSLLGAIELSERERGN